MACYEKPAVDSVPPSRYQFNGKTYMEAQIHQLEQDAYSAVLRAFKAQSDALTWVCIFSSLHIFYIMLYFISRNVG